MSYRAVPESNGVQLKISDTDTYSEHLIKDPTKAEQLGIELIQAAARARKKAEQ